MTSAEPDREIERERWRGVSNFDCVLDECPSLLACPHFKNLWRIFALLQVFEQVVSILTLVCFGTI